METNTACLQICLAVFHHVDEFTFKDFFSCTAGLPVRHVGVIADFDFQRLCTGVWVFVKGF